MSKTAIIAQVLVFSIYLLFISFLIYYFDSCFPILLLLFTSFEMEFDEKGDKHE